jgi:hypothetical protein
VTFCGKPSCLSSVATGAIHPWPSVGEVYARVGRQFGVTASAEVLEQAFRSAWKETKRGALTTSDKEWWRALVHRAVPGAPAGYFEALYEAFPAWRMPAHASGPGPKSPIRAPRTVVPVDALPASAISGLAATAPARRPDIVATRRVAYVSYCARDSAPPSLAAPIASLASYHVSLGRRAFRPMLLSWQLLQVSMG